MTRQKWLRRLFVVAIMGLLLSWFLSSAWVGDQLCNQVRSRLPGLVPGLKVEIAQCRLDPIPLGVEVRGIAIGLPGENQKISTDRIFLRVGVFSAAWSWLTGGTLPIDRVDVDKPRIELDLSHLGEGEPEPKKPRKNSKDCEVADLLNKFRLSRLTVSDASAHLLLPGARTLDVQSLSVNARGSRGVTTLRVVEQGGSLVGPGSELPLNKVQISAQLDAPGNALELSRVEVQGGQLSVLAHGSVKNLCDPDLNLEASVGIPLDLVFQQIGSTNVSGRGYVSAHAGLTGTLDTLAAHVDVDASDLGFVVFGQHLDPDRLSLTADLQNNKLKLQKLTWPLGEGRIEIAGEIDLKGNLPFSATVNGKNVPFGELMNRLPLKHPWIDARVAVDATVKGQVFSIEKDAQGHETLVPNPTFDGPVSTEWDNFRITTHGWDAPPPPLDAPVIELKKAKVTTKFHFNTEQIHLEHTHLGTDRTSLDADVILNTDAQKGLDLIAHADNVDVDDLGPIAGLPWHGAGPVDARITGPYGEQVIDAKLLLRNFHIANVHLGDVEGGLHFDPGMVLRFRDVVAHKGATVYRGSGELNFGKNPIWGGGDIAVDQGGRIEDVLQIIHDVHWAFAMFDGQMTGGVDGSIHMKVGPIMAPVSDFDLKLHDLIAYQRTLGSAHFKMHTQDGDSMSIPPFELSGVLGHFTFGGWQRVGGELHYALDFDQVPVAVATAPELVDYKATGTLSGHLSIYGPSSEVRIDGEMYGDTLGLMGLPLGQGKVKIAGVGNSMAFTGPVGDDLRLDMKVRFEDLLPMRTKVTVNITDLFKYVPTTPQWNDVAGQVLGTLEVSGNMKDSTSYVGKVHFPTILLSKGDYTEENVEPVEVNFHGDVVDFKRVVFRGRRDGERSYNTKISLTGKRFGPDNALNLKVDGAIEAQLLESFYPWIESADGHLDVAAAVAGTQAKPEVLGTLRVRQGKVKVRDFPVLLSNLDGQVQFSENSVEIPLIRGTVNRGRAELSGRVALENFSPKTYALGIGLHGVEYRYGEFKPLVASGDVNVSGPIEDPKLSGQVSIDRFIYDENIGFETLVNSFKVQKLEARVVNQSPHVITYDNLVVHLDGDIRLWNNIIQEQLRGDLAVTGDNVHPILRGEIHGLEGGKARWRTTEFDVNDVRLFFNNPEKLMPEYDVRATGLARSYKINAHFYSIKGELQPPDITSDPSLPPTDILTLLGVGITSQDRGTNGVAAVAGVGLEFFTSVTGIDDQVKRFLPANSVLLKDPKIGFTTTYSAITGSMQPTAQFEGKLLTDRLKLKLQQPVIAGGRGTKAFAEYRISDQLSLQGALDRDNSDYTLPDVGLDLKYHLELK
jgi:translocation and assembly module TamB